jgi:hypothetical protein
VAVCSFEAKFEGLQHCQLLVSWQVNPPSSPWVFKVPNALSARNQRPKAGEKGLTNLFAGWGAANVLGTL